MTKIVTKELKIALQDCPGDRYRERLQQFIDEVSVHPNYITISFNTAMPHSRHVKWEKARDEVLRQAPHQRLIIVDCTGT